MEEGLLEGLAVRWSTLGKMRLRANTQISWEDLKLYDLEERGASQRYTMAPDLAVEKPMLSLSICRGNGRTHPL